MIIDTPLLILGVALPQHSTAYVMATGAVVVIILVLYFTGALDRLKGLNMFGIRLDFWSKKDGAQNPKSGNNKAPKPIHDEAKFEKEVVNLTRKARSAPAVSSSHEKKIQEGFDLLKNNDLTGAKKIFDKHTKYPGGLYGLAQVLELRNQVAPAIKYYWEVIRLDPGHGLAKEARQKIAVFQLQARTRKTLGESLQSTTTANLFFLAGSVDPVELARHLTALSNGEGGTIVIGIDAATKKPSDLSVSENFEAIVDAALTEYCTAPCLVETLSCSNPECKILVVYPSLNKPYRVRADGETEVWVADGAGGIRLANEQENQELRRKRRG